MQRKKGFAGSLIAFDEGERILKRIHVFSPGVSIAIPFDFRVWAANHRKNILAGFWLGRKNTPLNVTKMASRTREKYVSASETTFYSS